MKEPWQMTKEELDQYQEFPLPNSITPWEGEIPPVGTWRFDPAAVNPEDTELEQLTRFNLKDIVVTEGEAGVRGRPDYQLYVQWLEEGREPPPIVVVRHVNGELHSLNRRRVMAARDAGRNTILVWFSETNARGRNAWTHKGFIKEALAQGKPVPPKVLADYPELVTNFKEFAQNWR